MTQGFPKGNGQGAPVSDSDVAVESLVARRSCLSAFLGGAAAAASATATANASCPSIVLVAVLVAGATRGTTTRTAAAAALRRQFPWSGEMCRVRCLVRTMEGGSKEKKTER